MTLIQVSTRLTKTTNPKEHGLTLEGETGEVIHNLGDGYRLIKFKRLQVKKNVTIDRKKVWKIIPLEWYVHEQDFKICTT
jgi:hypothetical protein